MAAISARTDDTRERDAPRRPTTNASQTTDSTHRNPRGSPAPSVPPRANEEGEREREESKKGIFIDRTEKREHDNDERDDNDHDNDE